MPKLTLSFKGRVLSAHPLAARTSIGRDPNCEICIDSLAIAPRHLELRQDADGVHLTALDADAPVFLNRQRVEEAQLQDGDQLQVGKHTLTFSASAPAPTPAPAPIPEVPPPPRAPASPYLQVLSGPHMGRLIPLSRAMMRFGRPGGDCAMIVRRGDGHFLAPLEGQPPMIDGVPVADTGSVLQAQCRLRIGDTELQFFP
jgi:hypothetical protein